MKLMFRLQSWLKNFSGTKDASDDEPDDYDRMVDRLTAPKKRRITSSRNFRLYDEEPVKGEPEPDDDEIGEFDPTKPMMNIEYVTLDNLHDILKAEIDDHPEIGRVKDVVDNINFRIKAIKSMVQKCILEPLL